MQLHDILQLRTSVPAGGYTDGGLAPTTGILACFSPPIEVGVISPSDIPNSIPFPCRANFIWSYQLYSFYCIPQNTKSKRHMYCLYNSRMLLPSDCVFSRSGRTHVRLESYHIAIFSDMLYNSDRGDYCAYNNIKIKILNPFTSRSPIQMPMGSTSKTEN